MKGKGTRRWSQGSVHGGAKPGSFPGCANPAGRVQASRQYGNGKVKELLPQTPFLSELAVTRGRRMLTPVAVQAEVWAAGKAEVGRVW